LLREDAKLRRDTKVLPKKVSRGSAETKGRRHVLNQGLKTPKVSRV